MANDSTSFFYWYRRYKVRAVDMNNFQSAMVESARAPSEGLFNGAVLSGFDVTAVSGFSLSVEPGIAVGASGYAEVINDIQLINVSAATGALPNRSLLVIRPNLVDENFITSPTSPFVSVPLNQAQKSQIVLIPGTPSANPDYPSKQANDAILCGIYLKPGASSVLQTDLDFEVKEVIGVNSLIAQNQVRYDNRMRPYRSTPKILGIKPSQTIGSEPLAFTQSLKGSPSLFPLNSGSFVPQDTFVNFQTGAITGGDNTSTPLTPVIPTAANSIVCLVTLTRDDVLNFRYGVQGTYLQCLTAIRQQKFSGAGSIPAPNGELQIAFVVVSSLSGSISDIQVYDSRPFMGAGTEPAKYLHEVLAGVSNNSNGVFTLSQVPADPGSLVVWSGPTKLLPTDFTLVGQVVTITDPDSIPDVGQKVSGYYLVHGGVPVAGGGANGGYVVYGSVAAPEVVTAVGGVPAASGNQRQLHMVKSAGGAVTITANPQIVAGSIIGQEIVIAGMSDTDYITLNNGNGLITNGPWDSKSDRSWYGYWRGDKWKEISRT